MTTQLPQQSPQHFTLHVLAFLVLVVGLNLWLDHHRGVALANVSVVSMLSAAVVSGLGLTGKLLSTKQQEGLLGMAQDVLGFAFSTGFLVVAWGIALVLALTVSSVTVVAETEGARFRPMLTPGAEPRTLTDKALGPESTHGVARFLVATNPLGRAMRLTVPGYVPATFDVYPLVGRRVALGTDMRPSPSVLFRVPAGAHEFLGEGTRLVVRQVAAGQETVVADVPTQKNRSAFLLGRRREIPKTLRRDWEVELEADGVTRRKDDTISAVAMMLMEWWNPTVLDAGVVLEPGMTLVAELRAPGGAVAVATVTLGNDPLVDAALRPPGESQ